MESKTVEIVRAVYQEYLPYSEVARRYGLTREEVIAREREFVRILMTPLTNEQVGEVLRTI